MRTPAVLAISLLLSGNTLAKDAAGLFDKPAKVTKVPLAADPQNPQSKPMLSCFYFANFAVKQIDRGEVGAEQLSVVPLGGAEPYQCREANIAGEKVVDVKEWSGYFKGVKGNYVFFDADDGLNGGLGFAVFDASDGKKLFEDTTKGLHAIKLTPAGMVLKIYKSLRTRLLAFCGCRRLLGQGQARHRTDAGIAARLRCRLQSGREKNEGVFPFGRFGSKRRAIRSRNGFEFGTDESLGCARPSFLPAFRLTPWLSGKRWRSGERTAGGEK